MGSVSGCWSVWAKVVKPKLNNTNRERRFFFMANRFYGAKDTKKPRFAATAASRGLVLCDFGWLFLFHHGFDFLGLYGVDVAVGIAEAEGTVVAAAHGE